VMERLVALKVVSRHLLDSPEAVERFGREVRAAARLDHPNIVRAYDAEQADDLQLLVMEYVEGKSLSDVLRRKGPLPVAHACQYIRQAALGLQHAHEKGMVHRDLKPSNLMLTPRGVVKILDFGLAKLNSERKRGAELTQKDMAMGTPEYMAPEQALDTKNADIRADIYALGCTLYCLLAGRPPFRSADGNDLQVIMAHIDQEPPPVTQFRPEVPGELAALLSRMLAKSPDLRPQTPKEVAEALAAVCKPAPEKTAAKPVAPNPTAPPIAPPRPMTASASPFAELKRAARPRRAARSTARRPRPAWFVPVVAATGLLAVAAVVAGIVLTFKTKDGLVTLELDPSDAHVDVIEGKLTVKWAGDKDPYTIAVADGGGKLRISKAGFEVKTQEVTLRDKGGRLRVTLDPLPIAATSPARDAGPPPGPQPGAPDSPAFPPAPAATNGSIPFFNGQNLTGWQGRAGCWRVDNGSIVGAPSADPPKVNTFLISQKLYKDFDLKFRVRLKDGIGNSGVQFRSTVADWKEFKVAGPQVEIDGSADREFPPGSIVTEGGPTRQLPSIIAPKDVVKRIWNSADFNAMHIRIAGRHVRVGINGTTVVDGDFLSMPAEGVIAWQIHSRVPPKEITFSDIEFTELNGTAELAGGRVGNASADGFMPLFNGKDTTGWETLGNSSVWTVKNGLLTSSGPPGFLYTLRSDFANFHLRVKARINDGGNSGVLFRTRTAPGPRSGYEAQINSTHRDLNRTGSLYGTQNQILVPVREQLVPPNEWFSEEVIAQGNEITIIVNNKTTAHFVDTQNRFIEGRIALQQHNPTTLVEFRTIEIKELPPNPVGQNADVPKSAPSTAAVNSDKTLEGMAQLQAVDNELSTVTFPAQNAEAKARRGFKEDAIRELRAAIKTIGDGKRGKSVQDHLDRAREKIQKLERQIDPASAPKAKGKTAMQKQKGTVGRAETLLNQAIRTLTEAKVLDPPAP
ncbi:MAG TPA: family 16 glycoside hydrolase, partial [Gemmataceae bacterium]|nr:family 16 glycoside hydrolase [Gemmataceae bacterium]